jgi:hypothetical protein
LINWLDCLHTRVTEHLSSKFFFPTNILGCLGFVNSQPFPFGSSTLFPPGTLLFDSVKFTQKCFPLAAADPTYPLISVDVSMTLKYFQPELGAGMYSIGQGHNNMPWRGAPGDPLGDPLGGKYFWATRGGGIDDPPLLLSEEFNNMFVSPN